MGCKRPFEEMEFEELRFKHPRQLEYGNKPASFSEFVPCYSTPQELFITGKDAGGSCKLKWIEMHDKDSDVKISPLVEKDFVTSNPLSLANNTTGEEDAGFGPFEGVACLSPGYFEFDFQRRPFVPVDDAYSSLLNCSPRRHVPVGPNHQASIPIWRGNADEKYDRTERLESVGIKNCYKEKQMGTCVVEMPDSNLPTQENGVVGIGRADCCCLDSGSIRCVRQHVRESRENLRKSLGDKKFVNLGFSEMGEEVSHKWSEEEELDFHEVIYSNPVSLDRKFWNRLSAVFPSRSKKEIVSYYFNVFMLRKRASQNRFRSLEIDSDDDEWHGINGSAREVEDSDDEEDSAIESLGNGDDQHHHEDGVSEEESEDDDNSDDSNDYDVGQDREYAAKEHGVVDQMSKSFMPNSVDECQFDPVNRISDDFQDDCVFRADSCTSFECRDNMFDSCDPVNDATAFTVGGIRTENVECPDGKPDASLGVSDSFYSKVWDARNNISRPGKSFDLLPWDMIEDVFGDGKTKDD